MIITVNFFSNVGLIVYFFVAVHDITLVVNEELFTTLRLHSTASNSEMDTRKKRRNK